MIQQLRDERLLFEALYLFKDGAHVRKPRSMREKVFLRTPVKGSTSGSPVKYRFPLDQTDVPTDLDECVTLLGMILPTGWVIDSPVEERIVVLLR